MAVQTVQHRCSSLYGIRPQLTHALAAWPQVSRRVLLVQSRDHLPRQQRLQQQLVPPPAFCNAACVSCARYRRRDQADEGTCPHAKAPKAAQPHTTWNATHNGQARQPVFAHPPGSVTCLDASMAKSTMAASAAAAITATIAPGSQEGAHWPCCPTSSVHCNGWAARQQTQYPVC